MNSIGISPTNQTCELLSERNRKQFYETASQ